ncbi:MAG: Lrp/AsnC family transcriptional regulator [Thermoplasmata archaeon]|nr:MAG: Lrp/AsnC family transcriptional regulator [Thermoplasmata archaeon]
MVSEKVPVGEMAHGLPGVDLETLPIDELDQRILGVLLENSRVSNTEIANRLDVNESTVRRRIEALVNKEVISGFTVCLNNPAIDEGVRAYIYVKVDTPALDEVVDDLCSNAHALSVYRIVGAYDVVCEMVFDTMNELHRFYDDLFKRSIIRDIMAHIVVNCYKSVPINVR